MISADWPGEVLTFWFKETQPESRFKKDKDFDASIRRRFLALHEVLSAKPTEALFADARTALAAVIVFDQMSRNMFRDTPQAFASDPLAFWIAQAAVAKGFDTGMTKDERSFLYLPFEMSVAKNWMNPPGGLRPWQGRRKDGSLNTSW